MKIYNKSDFWFGIFCALAMVPLTIGYDNAKWWHYLITIAIAGKFIHRGLSESATKHQEQVNIHFKETAIGMLGKRYYFRTHLPWIMILAFYPLALILRFGFEIWLPIWVHVLFVMSLAVAAFYSLGVQNKVVEEIEKVSKHIVN